MASLSFLTYLRGIYKLNLSASNNVHSALIQSIYDCFIMAEEDIDLMRLEMCMSTATGRWLDYWGEFFSVYRKSDEEDEHYCKRIIDSVIKPKSTIPAIKDNIVDYMNSTFNKNYTRDDVLIKEPWKDVAKYSHKGALSKDARFCSGDYYSHAVLDINIPEEVTNDLVDLVNAVKAAGVKVIWSILNSYDIISGFNNANDAWAAYHRHIQTMTKRNQYTGLVLSNSSPNPVLSGSRQIWSITTSLYQWYAKVLDKDTDKSAIITKKDLIGLLDYYTEIEKEIVINTEDNFRVSDNGSLSTDKKVSGSESTEKTTAHLVKITDEMLKSLELMDKFLTLSYNGRMSTSEGILFEYTASHELFKKLMDSLVDFKSKNPDYYNSVQPPILNGERAMWLVQRNKNWLWNTPTMTHEDFFKLWEPFDDYEESVQTIEIDGNTYTIMINGTEQKIITSTRTKRTEHTINSIIEFEDAYYQGYITFGDQYQPPVVIGKKMRWTPRIAKEWMFNSAVFQNSDLEQLYTRHFYSQGVLENNNPTLKDIMNSEENSEWGYSTVEEEQPPIEITPILSES